jgi:cytochrome bd ubiquinol oxidase subunit II
VAVAFLAATAFATRLYDNYLASPAWLLVPVLAVASLAAVKLLHSRSRSLGAFAASCASILLVVATAMAGLFPNLIPSSLDPAASLTAFNSSSGPYTLKVMTIVALIFVPIVIAYQFLVYRFFRAKLTKADAGEAY